MPEPALCLACRLPLRPLLMVERGRGVTDVALWCPACGRHEVARGPVREPRREG